MKKILYPSKSQRNRSLGLFQAGSLASAQGNLVDMKAAKAAVRFNRQVHSGDIRRQQIIKATAHRRKQWWKYRHHWKMVAINGFAGKLHPHISGRVEFPNGDIRWVRS
jgi:hypothetical protein